ncbi:MAG: 3-isopropylmalate dehydrogenase [Lentisphaeria bacterium]|nr:3-isopropylmalate dehydrogenase [Lentisphaeria bacterium]NQZ69721.1 3-isopropylmalate dehydrogenase [Lentisphaeria bacterium]
MAEYKIALIPGDGIGKEVVQVGRQVLEKVAAKHNFELAFTEFPFGGEHYLKTGEVLSDESLDELCKHDIIYLGAVGTPDVKPGILEKGILLKLRFELDQYINLRPVKVYPGIDIPIKNTTPEQLDYIVVRENTGGLYTGVGGIMMKGTEDEVAIQSMTYNYKQVSRCLRYAFQLAESRPRKTLALIGKTNVLTHVFDLWDRVFHEIGAKEFPGVTREYYHVDAACMHMIRQPERFDVMVTTNMFGDIITDLGAETQGGMGMAASGNINPEKTKPSMFEPVHGSAPDIMGKGLANPIAAVITVKMMLDFLGETEAANDVDSAISAVTIDGFDGLGTLEIAEKLLETL